MALPLDPTVPLAGILLILLLVWLTGGTRHARLADGHDAAALLAAPETGFTASDIAVSADGDCAIARDPAGHMAVVFASGAKLAARRLRPAEIVAVTLSAGEDGRAVLAIRTAAFTHPDFTLRLARAAAEDWQRHLAEMPA